MLDIRLISKRQIIQVLIKLHVVTLFSTMLSRLKNKKSLYFNAFAFFFSLLKKFHDRKIQNRFHQQKRAIIR